MNKVPQFLKPVSQDAQKTRWCLLRSCSGDITHSPWSKVRRPGRASCVKRSDRVTLMPFPSQGQFLEKIKVTDRLVGMQHQEPMIQKVTAGAPQVRGRGQGGRESLSAETSSDQRATTMLMIQKTDEFTDAVQGEGCGCARCDAVTVTAEAVRSRLQFLNRVDDVQGVFPMGALKVTSAFSYGEWRSLHQFNDWIDNFVMRAVPSEKDSTSRALKWPNDDPTQCRLRRFSP